MVCYNIYYVRFIRAKYVARNIINMLTTLKA
jgi:hypothetical protein